MSYNWIGMKEIPWDNVKKLYKKKELTGAYFLYPDGTESEITEDCSYIEIMNHHDRGGTFGIEIPRINITFPGNQSATAPETIDWSKCLNHINETKSDIQKAVKTFMELCAITPDTPEDEFNINSQFVWSIIAHMIELLSRAGCTFDHSNRFPKSKKEGDSNE